MSEKNFERNSPQRLSFSFSLNKLLSRLKKKKKERTLSTLPLIPTYNNNKSPQKTLNLLFNVSQQLVLRESTSRSPFSSLFSSHAELTARKNRHTFTHVVSSTKREWASRNTHGLDRSRKLKEKENPGCKCKLIEVRFKCTEYMHVFTWWNGFKSSLESL